MKFGLHLDNAQIHDPSTIVSDWSEAVAFADGAGFDYISVVDHLVPFPDFRPRSAPLFDPWQLLSAFAALTKNVKLLTLVNNGSISHPTRLAKQAATLDTVSQGRMMLGLGAGGYQLDEAAMNLSLRSQRDRYAMLEECIDFVMELWTGHEVSKQGKFYALDGYTSSPVPQSPPNLLVAGKSSAILRIAAFKASACNFAFTNVDVLNGLVANLQALLEEAGRNLKDFDVTLLDRVFIASSDEQAHQAWQAAGAPIVNGHPGLVGGPARLVREIAALENSGANTLFCMFQNLASQRLFAEQVLPQLRSF